MASGIAYLVGAGPGDPGLLTLRGQECLQAATVVVYDFLANPEILGHAPTASKKIYVGKRAGQHTLSQDEINALLVKEVSVGHQVVRLKGGDPYLFGRGGEEAEALQAAGLPFEIVPGVTSAIAAPAYAGIPVTHRQSTSSLTIFTGHEEPGKAASALNYRALAQQDGTLVFLMGVSQLDAIAKRLMEEGLSAETPAAMVEWGTTPRQKCVTGSVADIASRAAEAELKAPAVGIFGEVVSLRDTLKWFDQRPLFGKRVLVTRTRKQASELSRLLRQLGAEALELPLIRIEPAQLAAPLQEALGALNTYDWVMFTSPNAVEHFFEAFYNKFSDARSFGGARIAAVGPATAKMIRHYRFSVDLMGDEAVAEGLLEALVREQDLENVTFLWPKAEETREVLQQSLEDRGAIVDAIPVYRTVAETEFAPETMGLIQEGGIDLVSFASSSAVEAYVQSGLKLTPQPLFASIGPITSAAMQKHNLPIAVEAEEHTVPGLSQAIKQALRAAEA
ncbi:MAG: uroporphyrinogen-III C-methyltransferase [Verrucomicrobiales bacterium]